MVTCDLPWSSPVCVCPGDGRPGGRGGAGCFGIAGIGDTNADLYLT